MITGSEKRIIKVDDKLEKVNGEISKVNSRCNNLQEDQSHLEHRFDNLENRFNKLEDRFNVSENDHQEILKKLDNVVYKSELKEFMKEFENRLMRVEHELGLAKTKRGS